MKNPLKSVAERGLIFTLFGLLVLAASSLILLTPSGPVMAQGGPAPNDPFVLLLKGVYQPVVSAPDLGLSGINLNDGSFMVTEIRAVNRIPGSPSEDNAVVGHFFVQFEGPLAVFDLPGGAIAMQFIPDGPPFPTTIPDGQGGVFLEGTFELTIQQATGIYSSFVGGHDHMVDRLHHLANGQFDENCYCIISLPSSLPLWWSSN